MIIRPEPKKTSTNPEHDAVREFAKSHKYEETINYFRKRGMPNINHNSLSRILNGD